MDLGAFQPQRTFKHGSQSSQADVERGKCELVTLGFGSNVEPYRVERVIGRKPLRQFLTPTSGGRWQVQELAYDPKLNQWFDVYGAEDRQPGEFGHWTGRGMNWNSRCAACHNTSLRKHYDEATDAYHTTMAEIGVACEACHGPLKAHVEWRKANPAAKSQDPTTPRFTKSQVLDNCGSCHSRRDELTGDFKPGDSFFDHFSLEVLDESGRWYPDGQVKDEDYELTSFLGSRMMEAGVQCRDCHRAHSGEGNALCLRCHQGKDPSFANAPAINPAEHGHHKLTDKGSECIGCHMPVTVYMQRHPRHDHGFTIPDPLLTRQLGVPNACNRCHDHKSVDWALKQTEQWYGAKMERHTRERAQWIGAALRGEETAKSKLAGLLSGGKEGAYWRAVAAGLLWHWAGEPGVQTVLMAQFKDKHPLVREKAVRALEPAVASGNTDAVASVSETLNDPVRNVRVAAAWVLRATVEVQSRAGRELQLALSLEADQPPGQYRQAMFHLAREQPDAALAHLQKAVAWDPFSPPLRYETAMVLNRLGRTAEALAELSRAEKLAPRDPQLPFGRATVLAHAGRHEDARAAARRALELQRDFLPAKQLLEELGSPDH